MGVLAKQLIALVADDSDDVRTVVTEKLCSSGHAVTCARTGKEAAGFLARSYFDLVVTDLFTADGTGLEVIEETKRRYPSARVLVMWDESQIADAAQFWDLAAKHGAHAALQKPFTPEEFSDVLRALTPCFDTSPPFPGNVQWQKPLKRLTVISAGKSPGSSGIA